MASPQLFDATRYRDDLSLETKVEETTDASGTLRKIRTTTLTTPRGILRQRFETVGELTETGTEFYVSDQQDLAVYIAWIRQAAQTILDNRDRVKADLVESIQSGMASRGQTGLMTMHIFTPMVEVAGFYFSQADGILFIIDHPKLLHELCELQLQTTKLWIEAGIEADIDAFSYAIHGLEILSPQIFDDFIVPYTRQINQWIRQAGLLSWHHCCGMMDGLIKMGYFDQMRPDVVESFSEPPEGDVTDLRVAREQLGGIMASRGAINSGHIRSQSPEQLRTRTRYVLESMQGFRHMIGATDALLPGTTLTNLQAISDTVKEAGRQFPWENQ